ncbi:MAG: HlyD family efflux transporter periplasmic adaptor subunit [Verrucomicrobia bacterium]|nr:HlyD family efflux transporter periplasmic adaptor subunit [Verrucomicrobiota bacterium]
MKNSFRANAARGLTAIAALLALTACTRPAATGWQGYLEGDFVYVASPLAGRLDSLTVAKGTHVTAGAPLFALERTAELAAQRQAADQLAAAQARVADLKKGSRPTELATLDARLAQARSAAELSKLELARQEDLFKTNVISAADIDRARLTHERNTRALDELAAQLATAGLGARTDAIAAAEADAGAAAAAKERADWNVSQKAQAAPAPAFVYDTLYRQGEFVAAGLPVVALLPPENLKVRFYLSEAEFAAVKAGDAVRVSITGRPPVEARVSYLSPKPEYTPPVLYNRENRAKLVFLVEAVFADPAVARNLHPGQPVDVTALRAP